MKLVVVIALVTIIAFLGSRYSFVRLRLPIGVENLFLTGAEYVLVGFLLGEAALDLLDGPTLEGLYPFMGLGLSWIGMLFGVQWEFRRLVSIPHQVFTMAFVQAISTMIAVAIPFYFFLAWFFPDKGEIVLIGAITLGAAASTTAQSGLALGGRHTPSASRPLMRLLQNIANLDGLIGVIAFGLVSCLAVLHGGSPAYLWIGASLGLGALVGLLMTTLTAYRLNDQEMLLVVIGAVTFSGGLALYLNLSPLLVNLIAGIVVANMARTRAQDGIRNLLLRGEHSIYILFLILVGAGWKIGSVWVVGLVLIYLCFRTIGKVLGGALAIRFLPGETAPKGRLGLGLLSHGGMAIAIVVNLQQIHRSALTDSVISVVVLGMLVSELISPSLVKRFLEKGL